MSKIKIDAFKLIGLKLSNKTSNEGGQSGIDCGSLWQKFNDEKIAERITKKSGDEIYAVYFDYEGDHTKPFSYFIGCKVETEAPAPTGLDVMHVPADHYTLIVAKGKMPDCLINTWKKIWATRKDRAYRFDFEKYDERSRDWNSAQVDVYLSSK